MQTANAGLLLMETWLPSGLEQRKWAALDATVLQEFIQHSFGRNEANTVL